MIIGCHHLPVSLVAAVVLSCCDQNITWKDSFPCLVNTPSEYFFIIATRSL